MINRAAGLLLTPVCFVFFTPLNKKFRITQCIEKAEGFSVRGEEMPV